MKILKPITSRIENMLSAPGEEMGRLGRLIRFQIYLWRFCLRRLREDNAMAMSSALSFRTIFALIPVLVLALLIAKSVGVLADTEESMQKLFEATGIAEIAVVYEENETAPVAEAETVAEPNQSESARKESIAEYLQSLVDNVETKLSFRRVGPIGVALLIWSALTLLTTMERSLNRIYRARASRALARRVMLYWSVVTLGPVLLVTVKFVGERIAVIFHQQPIMSGLLAVAGLAGNVLIGIILLAALYKFMPNTRVSYRSALGGAIIAVPLWMLAKWGFSLYVMKIVLGKQSIYGALGLLPLFVMWLNFSWLIFLFGAELSNTAANLGRMRSAELASKIVLGPTDMLAAAIAVGQAYITGQGPVAFEEIAGKLNLPDESVEQLLDRLNTRGIVCPVESDMTGAYVLARPAEQIKVLEILEIEDAPHFIQPQVEYHQEISQILEQVRAQSREALGGYTLAQII